jgi:hypothetical protein
MSEATAPPPARGTSGLGIAALVLGLVGLIIGLIPCVGWMVGVPLGALALLLGLIGLATAGTTTGKGMPIVGSIIGVLAIVLSWYATPLFIMLGLASAESAVKKELDDLKTKANASKLVTASDLLKAYKDDPKKADTEYKGKMIRVKGKVESATGSVTFKSDDDKIPGIVKAVPLIIAVGEFGKLNKGDQVTVWGKCDGKTGDTVAIESAIVVAE